MDKFQNENDYNVFIPYNRVSCRGIIRNEDTEITLEGILNNIRCNLKRCEILTGRRLNRRSYNADGEIIYKPPGTICLSFSGVGLPREVFIFGLAFLVSPYILLGFNVKLSFVWAYLEIM